MSDITSFRHDGKRALIIGGSSGMGAAAARTAAALGAQVTVLDFAPIDYDAAFIKVDLSDKSSVDSALAELTGEFDSIFSAAGVADGHPMVVTVNFIAHRYIVERLLEAGQLRRGAGICMISSATGRNWDKEIPVLTEFLEADSFEAAEDWVRSHEGKNTYKFSKQAMNCYVAREAFELLKHGVRINAICPGPTDTPLARANADTWLTYAQDYRDATGAETLTADQMGDVMAFLNSPAASGISGVTIMVDAGYASSTLTGSFGK